MCCVSRSSGSLYTRCPSRRQLPSRSGIDLNPFIMIVGLIALLLEILFSSPLRFLFSQLPLGRMLESDKQMTVKERIIPSLLICIAAAVDNTYEAVSPESFAEKAVLINWIALIVIVLSFLVQFGALLSQGGVWCMESVDLRKPFGDRKSRMRSFAWNDHICLVCTCCRTCNGIWTVTLWNFDLFHSFSFIELNMRIRKGAEPRCSAPLYYTHSPAASRIIRSNLSLIKNPFCIISFSKGLTC